MRSSTNLLLSFAFLVPACSGSSSPITLDIPPQCNPLRGDDARDCVTPWPSITYEKTSSTTASRMQVDVPPGALPSNADGTPLDPSVINRNDGFSPIAPMVVHFKEGVSIANLPPWKDPAQSLAPDCPTAILQLDGTRVLHFAEVDATATDPTRQGLYIRPLIRLKPKTTYVVVLRKSVLSASGQPLPVPAGFQALLDGTPTDDPRLEALRPEYQDNVFKATDAAGIPRSDLLLAWDFTTSSDELLTSHIKSMRDQALAAIGDGSKVAYTITNYAPGYGGDGTLYALVEGTFKAPLFLTNGGAAGSVLALDAAGTPKMMGTYDVPFSALVPEVATTTTKPLPLLLFGHGLFGDAHDYLTMIPFLRQAAQNSGAVMVATDWQGLSRYDIPQVSLAINDLNLLPAVTDRLQQAVVNTIVLVRFARTALAGDSRLEPMGKPVISPTEAYYYGISLGGIMGDTFMAYDPDIIRGVLNVPGGDWNVMMERSSDWANLAPVFAAAYPDPLDHPILISYLQSLFDYSDPITTAPYVLENGSITGAPKKLFLMQESRNDMQVTNIATETVARTLGIPQILPTDDTPYGIPTMKGPLPSALTIYDTKPSVLPNVTNAVNPNDNGAHDGVYPTAAAYRQLADFLMPMGVAKQECTGTTGCICNPPADSTCN